MSLNDKTSFQDTHLGLGHFKDEVPLHYVLPTQLLCQHSPE